MGKQGWSQRAHIKRNPLYYYFINDNNYHNLSLCLIFFKKSVENWFITFF